VDDADDDGPEQVELPGDAAGYLAALDVRGWFDDLPADYVAQARAGVAAAYERGDHPATGLAIHSLPHSDDAEPLWFGTLLREVAARSHGLAALGDPKVTKSKRGDYVAKARVGEELLQETIYEADDPAALDPILGLAVLLERALEARGVTDVTFGWFTDEARVLHWYLRPRDVVLPVGLIPEDLPPDDEVEDDDGFDDGLEGALDDDDHEVDGDEEEG
jgi:hypothetical protein